MLQAAEQHKINWLRTKCFRVKMTRSDLSEYTNWLQNNLEEKEWAMSSNLDTGEHTFFFENAHHASSFREQFKGESRTVDIS